MVGGGGGALRAWSVQAPCVLVLKGLCWELGSCVPLFLSVLGSCAPVMRSMLSLRGYMGMRVAATCHDLVGLSCGLSSGMVHRVRD